MTLFLCYFLSFLLSFFASFSVTKDHIDNPDMILFKETLSPSAAAHLMSTCCIYNEYSPSRTMEQAELTNGTEGMQGKVT